MIRIDEIYYNTVISYLQDRKQTSVHWFDPFGSVRFDDLKNSSQINNKHGDAQRYLFWDQEPITPTLFQLFADQFVDIYDGRTRLITSEYNSEFVDWAVDTYGFTPHYYFFHGWAALDWYRGYNHSYLMPNPEDRSITRTFINPNRIIAGGRRHRLVMLYHIFKYNMNNNWISCPDSCPAENIKLSDAVKQIVPAYPDAEKVFAQQHFPMEFPEETGAPMHSNQLSLFDECSNSLLYLVAETVASGRRQHLTEKIFKPICLRMPFILVGTQGSLAYLRSYGFRTFGELWDESYDNEINDDQRIEKISWVLRALDHTTVSEKQRLFDLAQEVCEHNYNHFYSGGFEQILWKEMQDMLNEF